MNHAYHVLAFEPGKGKPVPYQVPNTTDITNHVVAAIRWLRWLSKTFYILPALNVTVAKIEAIDGALT